MQEYQQPAAELYSLRRKELRVRHPLIALGYLVVVGIAALITGYFILRAKTHPPCCDVVNYWQIAEIYRENGIFAVHGQMNLRTYAYPGILALCLMVARGTGVQAELLLAILQFVGYVGSSFMLAYVMKSAGRQRFQLFALLALNIFALPYLAIGLADAVALILFQLWLALTLMQWRADEDGGNKHPIYLCIASFMAGLAMEARPAYVWLPVVALIASTYLIPAIRGTRLPQRAFRFVLCAVFVALPLLPQIAINRHHFDRLTPLPTFDLQAAQISWGKANLKYATRMYAPLAPQLFYPNPFYDAALDVSATAQPMRWYVAQPVAAAATLTAKTVGAFDFDFIEPYVYDPNPPMQIVARWLSLSLLFFGVCGSLAQAGGLLGSSTSLGPRWLPVLLLAGWGSVTLLSVVELRFTLPIVCLFLLLSFLLARELARQANGWRFQLQLAAAWIVAVVAIFSIAQLSRDVVQIHL